MAYKIDPSFICANEAIQIKRDKEVPTFLEVMVEYTGGVLKNKAGKALFARSDPNPGAYNGEIIFRGP